ncbi:MAG: hypothetical protein KBD31_01760 [Proteobacteria bacterium]|nr:hypothetical protein [Pseudomonadota bacterium]
MLKNNHKKTITPVNRVIKSTFIVAAFASISIIPSFVHADVIAGNNISVSTQNIQETYNHAEKNIENLFGFVDPEKGSFVAALYSTLDSLALKVQTANANNTNQIAGELNELIAFTNAGVEFFTIRRDFMIKIENQMKADNKLVEPIFKKFLDIGTRIRTVKTSAELQALNNYARPLLNS